MDDSAPTQPVPAPTPPLQQADVPVSDSEMQHLLDAVSSERTQPQTWQPPSVEELQRALPQYEVSAFIARGGMGAVYKGMQKALKRPVAIKVLPPDIDNGDMHFAERFKLEAQAMARLSHPNIVSVFEAGETGEGLLYFVMEFIEGTDVQQMIKAEGRLEPQHALSIIAHVCDALAFAHEEGVIHRDIKPSNIVVDKKGRVKVADFGLAKAVNVESTMLTSANMAVGTPDFIAPEALISGAQVDRRADIYALGVMLYVTLTGHIPRGRFQMPTGVLPKLDPRYDAIVDKAMQTDRELRYPSAAAMRADIDRILSTAIATEQPTAAVSVSRRAVKPLLIGAVVVAVLATASFLILKDGHASHTTVPMTVGRHDAGAIKLWDSPDKITPSNKVRWEKNAVRLDGQPLEIAVSMRDLIVRASVLLDSASTSPQMHARIRKSASGKHGFYSYGLSGDGKSLALGATIDGQTKGLKQWPLPRAHDAGDWLLLELRLEGDALTASADGVVLGTVHDASLPEAGSFALFANAAGYFRDIEYVPLDQARSAASPSPASKAAALEPRAIQLWDSSDKLPKASGVRWDSGSLRLDRASVQYNGSCSRDAVLRAELRYNTDITNSGLSLRTGFDESNSYYVFSIARDGLRIALDTSPSSAPASARKTLKTWPIPASIKADQWVQLEFRIVDHTLTAMLDGQILGSVEDSTLTESGGASVHSNSTGFFRNIVYVPLDPVPPLEPGTLKLWATAESLPKQENVRWEKGTVVLDDQATLRHTGADSRDAIVRADLRRNPDRRGAAISLRHREDAATHAEDGYRLTLNLPAVTLGVVRAGKITELKSWPLHAPATNDDWVHLELRAIGDTFTVTCDGQKLGSVKDSTLTAPGTIALSAVASGRFRYVTYTPLDQPAVPPMSKP